MNSERKLCDMCGSNNGNRSIVDYVLPTSIESRGIIVDKEKISNIINAKISFDSDWDNNVEYEIAIENRRKHIEDCEYDCFQKWMCYDNTKQGIALVATHLTFIHFLGIRAKCNGCALRLKTKLFKGGFKTVEDIEIICNEYLNDILKKNIKKNKATFL